AAECPICVYGEWALQSGKFLAGSLNPRAAGFPPVVAQSADLSKRSRGSLLSSFVCCQEAGNRAPEARAKSASVNLPAYRIFRRGKACRRLPLRSFPENRASLR